jgi:PAS domain S-box-containing protein
MSNPPPGQKQPEEMLTPLKIITIYALVGGLWVFFGDLLLAAFVRNPSVLIRLQALKDWLYVVATAWMLYRLIRSNNEALQRSEATLRESGQRLRSTIEHSSDGIVLVDEQGYVVEWNQGAEQIFGLKAYEALGRPVWDIQFQTAPKEQARSELRTQFRASFQEFLETGEAPWLNKLLEQNVRRTDGTLKYVQALIFPIETDRGFMASSIIRDVTERRRAEEELARERNLLRTLVDNLPDLVYVKDTGSRFVLANAETARVMGAKAPDELIGKLDSDFYPQEIAEQYYADEQLIIRRGRPLANKEEPLLNRTTGERGWLLTTKVPLRDSQRKIVGVVGIGRDITERKQMEMEREKLIAELDAFAHTVAHDLKNPLSILVGFVNLLEDGFATLTEDELKIALDGIQQSTFKMIDIIDTLLLLASVRGADVETRPLDMGQIVEAARQRLDRMIEKAQGVIVAPAHWPVTIGYSPWVEEIWVNYLSNAIKYGGKPPRIELGASPQPDGMIRFWIRDNGPGIAPEAQKRLFTPFSELAQDNQFSIKGHGLGLSIVRRIAQKLGGEVGVESEVGKGSTFSFTLPGAPN